MKSAIAIRHVAFEDLGSWESLIKKHFLLRYVDAVSHELPALLNSEIGLLVVLGGPIGVYQEQEYPFIHTEIRLLQERLQLDLPTLGICLGSQLMARALGSKVYPNHSKEIGWQPLTITDEGNKSCVHHLASAPMFHWHGDTFDLPKEAKLLASTAQCTNQIFSIGQNGLGFQCHPEVTAQHLESWWIGHAAELAQNNLSVNALRAESKKLSPALETHAEKCLSQWLSELNVSIIKK